MKVFRKWKQMTIAALAVIALLVFILYIFQPVNYSIDESVEKISIRLIACPTDRTYEITNNDDINKLLSTINKASYRQAIMLSYEAPDNLLAVIRLKHKNESIADIMVTGSTVDHVQFYIHDNGQHLVAYNDTEISGCISDLLSL